MFDAVSFQRLFAPLVVIGALTASPSAEADTPAHIRDIQISAQGYQLEILVLLSEQPTGATASIDRNGVLLTFDGVTLSPFDVTPPSDELVSRASGSGDTISLKTAALSRIDTTLYRRSILLEGQLVTPVATPAPKPATKPPTAVKPKAPVVTADVMTAQAPSTRKISQTPRDAAGLDDASCAQARQAFDADNWNIDAMGEHVLCLMSAGHSDQAAPLVDQLEAFAPDDWRGVFARAELHRSSSPSLSEIAYRNAIALCDTANGRAVITHRLASLNAG